MNNSSLCVLGLGYIGLPTASTFATHGLKVIGVDINKEIIHGLKNGQVHLYEPGLRTLVQAALQSGNLIVQDTPAHADAFIISVPTPITAQKKANLSYVISAAESILPYIEKGNLVILESTSPPRTTVDVLAPILEKSGLQAGKDFHLAYSPERVLPGKILQELIENTRIIGGIDSASAQAGKQLYEIFVRGEIIMTDATTAEMVKLMENTYRDINIAIANEFTRMADHFGVDIWESIRLANRHPRVNILKPGVGVGGHCISVDPWFLVETAPDFAALVKTARLVNDNQPAYVVDFIKRNIGDVKRKTITILGLAYKPNVDDLRESPAIEVVKHLIEEGATINIFEPYKSDFQLASTKSCGTLKESITDSDLLLLLVAHDQFLSMNPDNLFKQTNARTLIDCTGLLERPAWEQAGFRLLQLGQRNLTQ